MLRLHTLFAGIVSAVLAGSLIAAGMPPSAESINQDRQVLLATLLGEIALQRNMYGDAYAALMSGAKVGHKPELADRALQIAKAAKDDKKTKESLALLKSIDPENAHILIERYKKQLTEGQFKSIPSILTEKIRKSDSAFELLREITLITAKNKNKKDRFEFLESIASCAPFTTQAKTQMMLAYTAGEAKEKAKALEHALTGARLEPTNGQMLLESADYQFEVDPQETKKRLLSFLEKFPNDVNVRLGLARLYAKTQHQKESLSELEKTLSIAKRIQKDFAQTLYFAGNIAEENNSFEEAKNYYLDFLQAIDGNKNYIPDDAFVRLGVLALNTNNLDKALHYFQRVEKGDKYVAAKAKAAEILASKNRIDEACQVLKSVHTNDKQQKAGLFEACAGIFFEKNRTSDGIKVLQEAVELDPNNAAYIFHAASVATRVEARDLAIKLFQRYIQLRPQDPQGYNSLGYLWLDMGIKTREARPLIEKAYELSSGNDASIVDSMAWLLFREQRYAEAQSMIDKALKASNDPEIRLHKAEILLKLGKSSEAKAILIPLLKEKSVQQRAKTLIQEMQ